MSSRSLLTKLVLAGALFFGPVSALADDWSQFEATDDTVLADQRGGFLVVDGIAFDFAAKMQTFIDGQLALETTLTWTPDGQQIQHTAFADMVTDQANAIQSMVMDSNQQLLNSGSGIFLAGDGQTLLVQQATNNGLQNVVITTADGQTIRQDLAMTLTLPSAADFAATVNQSQLSSALSRAGTQAAIDAQ